MAAERLAAEESPEALLEVRRRSTRYLADRMTEIVDASDEADLELEVDPTRAHAALDLAVSQSWWDIATNLGRNLRTVYRANWDLPALASAAEALITANLATAQPSQAVRAARDIAEIFASREVYCGEALSWAQRAERIAAEHGLSQEHVEAYLLIAKVATTLAEYKTAYAAMITAHELLELHGRADESVTVLVNLAKLADHAPEVVDGPRDASWWADRATTLADRVGTPVARATAHFVKARIASGNGERDLAIRHYRVAGACYVSTDQPNNAAVAAQNTATLLTGDLHGAHAAWAEAVRLWRQCPNEPARTRPPTSRRPHRRRPSGPRGTRPYSGSRHTA